MTTTIVYKQGVKMSLYHTDPSFINRHDAFVDGVEQEEGFTLEDRTRYLVILAALMGTSSVDYFSVVTKQALKAVSPIEIKELVYQGVDYLGMGRTYPFIKKVNEVLQDSGILLPLEDQATTTRLNRLEKGIEAQVAIFGDGMKDYYSKGHVNRLLAEHCFGDYYTRNGLSLKDRELITFCFLAGQGGAENQLSSHVFGNLNVGNDVKTLLSAVTQMIPYIGYPRSLNAISVVNSVTNNK
jgi:4-carboxymuconolactone decarboxylase